MIYHFCRLRILLLSVSLCFSIAVLYGESLCKVARISTASTAIRKESQAKGQLIQRTQYHTIRLQALYSGFNHPWGMAWYTSHSRKESPMIVSERNGAVWLLSSVGNKQISGLPSDVCQLGQGGWFDIVQASNATFYLSYAKGSRTSNRTAVISFSLHEQDVFDPRRKTVIAQNVGLVYQMNKAAKSFKHYGGMLSIGYDSNGKELLLIGLGERGQRYEAQDLNSDHGTIQAISLAGHRSRTVSYGNRNIQGLYYDSVRRKLYQTEHGPQGGDELNLIKLNRSTPANYGWPVISYGREYGSGKPIGQGSHKAGMEQPLYYWQVSPALSGLTGYYGEEFQQWSGHLLASSLKFQQIYRLKLDQSGSKVLEVEALLTEKLGRIRSIKNHNGVLYMVTDQNPGKVYRIENAKL